jgi:hypothetical protein
MEGTMKTWPASYQDELSGVRCILCAEGRPEEQGARFRFYASACSDGYLHLQGVQRGYVALIWRGRHVVDPTGLSADKVLVRVHAVALNPVDHFTHFRGFRLG